MELNYSVIYHIQSQRAELHYWLPQTNLIKFLYAVAEEIKLKKEVSNILRQLHSPLLG